MQTIYRASATVQHSPVSVLTVRPKRKRLSFWIMLAGLVSLLLVVVTILAIGVGLLIIAGSGRILPGVAAGGIALSGLSVDQAAAQLTANWSQITLRDGNRTWTIPAVQLGLTLNAQATAANAQHYGRGEGSILTALLGHAQVEPVISINAAQAEKGLKAFAPTADRPAANATVRLVSGQLTAVAAVVGRTIDLPATLNYLSASPSKALVSGTLNLIMHETQPTVTDASPLLAHTRTLLASPLTLDLFDPISNQAKNISLPPDQWGQWLTTENTPSGIDLTLDKTALTGYLNGLSLTKGASLKIDESLASLQAAISAGKTNAMLRLYHTLTHYTVASGDTLGSISWQVGIPMWRITKANPSVNLDTLSVGQVITLPSKDDMLPLPIVYGKRIVVSISKQHMWVYDQGQLKWDWLASTGISSSPTMPGIFQVQSHVTNAYAANWNLYMPSFMGIYEAVPGFMNGIHGFPSRGGYQILWENALGREVTYGCILLNSKNADALYNWTEDGVIVEIQG